MTTNIYLPLKLKEEAKVYIPNLSKFVQQAVEQEILKHKVGVNPNAIPLNILEKEKQTQTEVITNALQKQKELTQAIEVVQSQEELFNKDKYIFEEYLALGKDNLAKEFCQQVCGKYGLSPREFYDRCTKGV